MTDNSSQKTKQNTNINRTLKFYTDFRKKIEKSYYFNFNRCNNYINSKIKRQG